MADATNEYDAIPYPSIPFPQSHPDRMLTVARWLGMDPPPADPHNCRVLELGCARGDNLIPLALELPQSEFVGIDLSAGQIAAAEAACQGTGAGNVQLIQGDILRDVAGLGEFDYIIAHGVYSWVPPNVRKRVLEICGSQLRPGGVAYVSYNVYPGWRQSSIIRDLLLFHTREITDPQARLEQGLQILRFFVRNIPPESVEYRGLFEEVLRDIEQNSKQQTKLYHDFLEPNNTPVFFLDFAQQAQQSGLQFLGEASIPQVQQPHLLPEVQESLQSAELPVREQYYDFLNNSKFRQSLVCRADASLSREVEIHRLAGLHLATEITQEQLERDRTPTDPLRLRVTFQDRPMEVTIEHPLTFAALSHLATTWPQTVAFEQLETAARARLAASVVAMPRAQVEQDTQQLARELIQLISLSLVGVHAYERTICTVPSERPIAGAWIRWRAAQNEPFTNLHHQSLQIPDGIRALLSRLDGTRTFDELLEWRRQRMIEKDLVFFREGQEIHDDREVLMLLRDALREELKTVARMGLLIG